MAIEDYFKGSSQAYGQIAGSLLAGRRKEDKKEAKRALIASTVMASFGALQNKQKQDIFDATNDVKDKYQDIFDNNEEIYNKKRGARADYLAYKENPNDYIETKAAELFNKDLELQAELGTNPYSRISKADLTPESYESAMEVLKEKRTEAKNYIEAQAGNAAVTTQTFTKFNAAAKEELINNQIKTGEEKASRDSFMYETKTMKLEKQEKEIIKSIEEARTKNILAGSKEEKELEDNIITAYRKGYKVSKIKELDEIQENDIPAFVSTFIKVDRIRADAPDIDPTDFLTVKERDLYDLGMGITRDDINAVEEIRNTENRLEVVSQINSMIGQETDVSKKLSMIDGNFGTDGTDATGLSSVYISNVIRAKTHLMNKYDMDDIEALQTAMDMQLEGVSIGTGGSGEDYNKGWIRKTFTSQEKTHGIEYVNPDVENLPIIPDTANLHAQNLNEYKYLQNRSYIDDEGNSQTLRPDRVGKEYTVDDEDFTVSFIVNNENKWIPSVTYK